MFEVASETLQKAGQRRASCADAHGPRRENSSGLCSRTARIHGPVLAGGPMVRRPPTRRERGLNFGQLCPQPTGEAVGEGEVPAQVGGETVGEGEVPDTRLQVMTGPKQSRA